MRVVADAGPIIHLSWIQCLDLLPALFEAILIPPAVRDELLAAPTETRGRASIASAIAGETIQIQQTSPVTEAGEQNSVALDRGEREAILLAEEYRADLFLTDDAVARAIALRRGLRVMGTIGVLRAARDERLLPAVMPHLLTLRSSR